MPLSGTVCCQDGLKTDFATCHARCSKRECVYPLPLIDSMKNNEGSRHGTGLSATTILQCPRQTVLKGEVDYFESPADYHARWRGKGVHAMAESGGPYEDVIQERRIRKNVTVLGESISISGQPDWFDRRAMHLDDWKSCKKCPAKPYDDHTAQVNIYAWLIHGGIWDGGELSTDLVESAAIVYIDADRSVIHPIDLWSTDAVESMVIRRIEPIMQYRLDGILPAGISVDGGESWKRRFCPFRGSGQCCADTEEPNGKSQEDR